MVIYDQSRRNKILTWWESFWTVYLKYMNEGVKQLLSRFCYNILILLTKKFDLFQQSEPTSSWWGVGSVQIHEPTQTIGTNQTFWWGDQCRNRIWTEVVSLLNSYASDQLFKMALIIWGSYSIQIDRKSLWTYRASERCTITQGKHCKFEQGNFFGAQSIQDVLVSCYGPEVIEQLPQDIAQLLEKMVSANSHKDFPMLVHPSPIPWYCRTEAFFDVFHLLFYTINSITSQTILQDLAYTHKRKTSGRLLRKSIGYPNNGSTILIPKLKLMSLGIMTDQDRSCGLFIVFNLIRCSKISL